MKTAVKFLLVLSIILVSFFLWLNMGTSSPILWNTGKESVQEQEKKDKEKAKDKEQTVHITRQDGTSLKLPLETYLEGVIGSEMPASFEMEALKAQCVAARTFVTKRGFEVDDTTRTQVYHDDKQMRQIWGSSYDKMHARVVKALQETDGEILTYQGEPISAVFFSGSCGKTANSEEYWDSRTPYLRSVDSHWDKEEDGYEKTAVISEEDFHTMLGFENPVKEVGKPSHYASGYVKSITIDRIVFSGREIREKLNLRSSCFSIKKTSGGYAVTTRGFGHGLGMSQYGAQGMALEKKNYKEILKHYYTGVQIVKE